MLLFSKEKLVFLAAPKTGSTAYEEALRPHADIAITDPPELKHSPVFRYNRFFRPMMDRFVGQDLTILSVMREPIDWLGSWYRYRQRPFMEGKPNSTHEISFDDFINAYTRGQQPGFANVGSQAKFLEPAGNGTCVTHLFRYEDQSGLKTFLHQKLGVDIKTERRNVSPQKTLSLSPEVEAKLRRKCAKEFGIYESIGENGDYAALLARKSS